MSVAVMPFTPASASVDDEGVAERVTQDLTTAIEYRWRYALVVSHSLAAKYKGQSLDPRAVGHDLNVRYLVEGNVRNANGGLVVMARLIETTYALERIEQILVPIRLCEKLNRARLHGPDRHRNIAMPRYEDDRDIDVRIG